MGAFVVGYFIDNYGIDSLFFYTYFFNFFALFAVIFGLPSKIKSKIFYKKELNNINEDERSESGTLISDSKEDKLIEEKNRKLANKYY
jgi:hypothetical protein